MSAVCRPIPHSVYCVKIAVIIGRYGGWGVYSGFYRSMYGPKTGGASSGAHKNFGFSPWSPAAMVSAITSGVKKSYLCAIGINTDCEPRIAQESTPQPAPCSRSGMRSEGAGGALLSQKTIVACDGEVLRKNWGRCQKNVYDFVTAMWT